MVMIRGVRATSPFRRHPSSAARLLAKMPAWLPPGPAPAWPTHQFLAPEVAPPPSGPSARAAVWVFAGVEAMAAILWLIQSRSRWFFADEWAFLTNGSSTPLDLLDDHNAHWTTLPRLLYRVLWELVGLNSYLPYVVCTIAGTWRSRCSSSSSCDVWACIR